MEIFALATKRIGWADGAKINRLGERGAVFGGDSGGKAESGGFLPCFPSKKRLEALGKNLHLVSALPGGQFTQRNVFEQQFGCRSCP